MCVLRLRKLEISVLPNTTVFSVSYLGLGSLWRWDIILSKERKKKIKVSLANETPRSLLPAIGLSRRIVIVRLEAALSRHGLGDIILPHKDVAPSWPVFSLPPASRLALLVLHHS